MAIRENPANDKRGTHRSPVHLLEQRYAIVRARDCILRTRIIDYSPFGIGVVLEGPTSRAVIAQGEVVQVVLNRNGQEINFEATLVTKGKMTIMNESYTRLGFKIASSLMRQHIGDARKNRRFELNQVVELSAHCDDPVNEGQKAFFSIEDLSATGLQLSTSSRNKFILPAMRLQLMLVIPGEGQFPEDLIVKHIRSSENGDRYVFGAEFIRPQQKTLAALADFCLSFGQKSSYQTLVDEGFPMATHSQSMSVHSTESPDDFQQILGLRLQDAHHRGLLLKISDPRQTADEHDDYARHVCVKVGSRVVASGRLVFNNGDHGRSTFGPQFQLPVFLWQQGFVSVSKIALDPEFQGSLAFLRLWNEIFRIAFLSGVAQMAFICYHDWPAILKNAGLDIQDQEALDPHSKMEFCTINLQKLLRGKDVPFVSWAQFVAPLIEKKEIENNSLWFLQPRLRFAQWSRSLMAHSIRLKARWQNAGKTKTPRLDAQEQKDKDRHVA